MVSIRDEVYDLARLSDQTLARHLAALCRRDAGTTALLLAHIGEFEARGLHLPEAYRSTTAYCVHELHMSEEAAHKRIHAARVARRFPAIFRMVAEGRLHLTAVNLLARYLTPENATSLLADATHKTNAELRLLLAERFPETDLMPLVRPLGYAEPSAEDGAQPAPERVEKLREVQGATASPERQVPPPRVVPLSSDGFAVQFTMSRQGHDDLGRAEELLSHQFAPGDIASVIEVALRLAIPLLEKRKYAATANPRASRGRTSSNPRYIPAHVKRAVRERDGDQCTYVSAGGRRCTARTRLEFDHVQEVARGGQATVDGIRQRCREHNQFTAEQTFGQEFMRRKREAEQGANASAGRAKMVQEHGLEAERERAEAERAGAEAERRRELDVVPWLRQLGYRAAEAREAAAFCESIPDAPLEERIKVALSYFRPRVCSRGSQARPNPAGTPGAVGATA